MSLNWQEIWNKEDRFNKIILDFLVKADGFDSGGGTFNVEDWIKYTVHLYNLIGIKTNDKLFEVGCGSGAFLYPLYKKGINVSGIDYSHQLIDIAQKFLPENSFSVEDAADIIRPEKTFDILLSHSVFQYFPNLEYAEKVFKNMVTLSNNKIAILDVCDLDKFEKYHSKRIEKFIAEGFSKEEYEKKYKGLDHLFYEKDWFLDLARKYNLQANIIDQNYKNYGNSEFRFNVFLEKNS